MPLDAKPKFAEQPRSGPAFASASAPPPPQQQQRQPAAKPAAAPSHAADDDASDVASDSAAGDVDDAEDADASDTELLEGGASASAHAGTQADARREAARRRRLRGGAGGVQLAPQGEPDAPLLSSLNNAGGALRGANGDADGRG